MSRRETVHHEAYLSTHADFQKCRCYLKETFLSASFEQENCQGSIHQITVVVFWGQAHNRNISLGAFLYRGFSKLAQGSRL